MTWNPARVKLFHAVYQAAAERSRFAPMDSFGSGLHLRRNMDAKHLSFSSSGSKRIIERPSVLGAITVRDATRDSNRFTGIAPSSPGHPAVPVKRGGLYTSEDRTALLAEMFHYADASLPRDRHGKAPLVDMATPKCFIKMKAVRELSVADLDDSSEATLRFLNSIQSDKAVGDALKGLGYRSLADAVWHGSDYAAGRGLGLGLASNLEIDGMRITSARGFTTDDVVGETGNNVLLFAADLKPASGLVQVTSMHLVETNPSSGKLEATHFAPNTSGEMVEAGATDLTKVP
jgi:hypothetical protein